ncbi:hypothetical protein A3207_08790 [Candidatus Methanomassiliicoccus intestinalis]|jgi:hypothetical protein|uniref:Preprotein translocase subunit SecB n=2 Tax=Candidatus Methanomassiliicoccus intestinalis TaxID=1406512 RepID=R9T4Q0_METII|nr:hypothetical protein [Candidatus Methanomassiliicoccus intestinalis]AGN25509.1 hypothetical protein MMINT_01010 [Candidatus Methanomassiliicoccus intestinalis Issoire-Mx1]TQS83042.1 MAG: hypothetical protein A3206_08615 [Candidatus Methanomassiliicoccus intestinalis]TQS83399.1 MAG: hypothetical protein A3207_08790 [Candidatus Methanomassiliicoccus intestinalis]
MANQIQRVEISAIEAKRFAKRGETVTNVRIDHNSTVTQVSKVSPNKVNVDFRFAVNYSGIGFIVMEGSVLLEDEENILGDKWIANGALPKEEAATVHNSVVSYCVPIAMFLTRDLHLPSPVPLPHINVQENKPPQMPPRSSIGPEFA